MSRSRMIIWNPIIFIGGFYEVEHCFKFPDDDHIMVDPYEIFATVCLFFFFNSLIILVYRNFSEFNELWFPDNFRINVLTFWHMLLILSCYLNVLQTCGYAGS